MSMVNKIERQGLKILVISIEGQMDDGLYIQISDRIKAEINSEVQSADGARLFLFDLSKLKYVNHQGMMLWLTFLLWCYTMVAVFDGMPLFFQPPPEILKHSQDHPDLSFLIETISVKSDLEIAIGDLIQLRARRVARMPAE